jgi:hypothetical protein
MLMNILKTIHAILALCLGALLFTGLAAALVAWLQLITR